jgi:serine/threonine-protein kinase
MLGQEVKRPVSEPREGVVSSEDGLQAGTAPAEGMMVTSNVRLVRPLGAGGMGSVWVAEHLSLRTHVVVKFMSTELAENADAIARFSREAAAASQVKSPHVVQMLDHGVSDGGTPYIVMELLEGRDLEQYVRERGSLPPREVGGIVAQLARALSKAHERGIVHRDIKPSNVFLLDAGGGEPFVKLLDFGIAKGLAPEAGGLAGASTKTGAFVGSPHYMSPEQVVGAKDVDFRTDLWSVGVLAYELLTGQKPFLADNMGALALRIHRDPMPVPSLANPELPLAIDAWFARACARAPAERFASAKEMSDALAAALAEKTGSGEAVAERPSEKSAGGPRGSHGVVSPTGGKTAVDEPLTMSGFVLPVSRSRWWLGAAVGLAGGAAALVAPRVLAPKAQAVEAVRTAPPRASSSVAVAAARSGEGAGMLAGAFRSAPAPAPTLAPTPALALAPALASALASAPAPTPTPTPTPPAVGGTTFTHQRSTPPRAAAPARPSALTQASAPDASAKATAPPGNDDDIK